jgi:capsular polysaccharide biosynthesis protein
MRLADYLMVLRRRWWIVLVTMLTAGVAAFGFSRLQQPVFRSTAEYQVTPSRYDNGLTIVMQNSMNRFRNMALAPIQLQRISDQLGLDRDADWMLERVFIQARPDEQKMIVQADYPEDPGKAQLIAQSVGDNMVALVGAQNSTIDGTDRIFVSIMQPARPAVLQRPQTRINVAAGLVLGLVLGLLLAFLLEALDNTLKTPNDVERFVGLTTLGAIPSAEQK